MKNLTPKFDNTAGSTGQLSAPEFNDFANDVQNAITESGQTLTTNVGDNNRQMSMAVATGGKRILRATGQTALIGEVVIPDNSAAACTINLPTTGLFVNATVLIEQGAGWLYTLFAVTVNPGGNKIMNTSGNMVMNSRLANNTILRCVWTGPTFGWRLSVFGILGR